MGAARNTEALIKDVKLVWNVTSVRTYAEVAKRCKTSESNAWRIINGKKK